MWWYRSPTVLNFCWNLVCQVGYDKQGLPIGIQLIGRPWCEASILRLAAAIEVWLNLPTNESQAIFLKKEDAILTSTPTWYIDLTLEL